MQTIKEQNEALLKLWNTHESARNVFFSMLDDSDDDSPGIAIAEEDREILHGRLLRALREKNIFVKIANRFPRNEHSTEIQTRQTLKIDIERQEQLYTGISNHRASKSSSLNRYAFTESNKSVISSRPVPVSLEKPCISWKLRFRQLEEAKVNANGNDLWSEMKFDEADLLKWWRRRHMLLQSSKPMNEPTSCSELLIDSDAWSDMKRLARRVVIQLLERIESLDLKKSRNIVRLKMMGERAREVVLYQIILCYNFAYQWIADLQELFEYTVPIVYLGSQIIKAASTVPANGIAENLRIENRLQSLDVYLRELRDRCYLFGDKIGFDVYKYKEDFNQGAIFDFDAENDHMSGGSAFIEMDRRLAGKNKKEYVHRVGSIGQKQLRVKENIRNIEHNKVSSVAALDNTERLESEVLEGIGLHQLDDVLYESHRLRGSGGYADVYEMKRVDDSKPLVAVKIYRPGPKSAKRAEREARIWFGIRHKHIAPLLGFVIFDSLLESQPCLVSELYLTDLKQLVRTYRKESNAYEKEVLTAERKLKFLRDIVFGLDYLHAMGIAHGDLRAANVLITNGLIDDPSCYAVLNDFGMAEFSDDDISHTLDNRDLSSVNQRTNDYWLAPELIEGPPPKTGSQARVSKAGDVYAFGVVYLEVIYEKDPYDGTLYNIVHAKLIGELPAKKDELEPADEAHWRLMKGCWEPVDKRWDVVEAACELLRILDKVLPPTPAEYVTSDMSGLPEGFTHYIM